MARWPMLKELEAAKEHGHHITQNRFISADKFEEIRGNELPPCGMCALTAAFVARVPDAGKRLNVAYEQGFDRAQKRGWGDPRGNGVSNMEQCVDAWAEEVFGVEEVSAFVEGFDSFDHLSVNTLAKAKETTNTQIASKRAFTTGFNLAAKAYKAGVL